MQDGYIRRPLPGPYRCESFCTAGSASHSMQHLRRPVEKPHRCGTHMRSDSRRLRPCGMRECPHRASSTPARTLSRHVSTSACLRAAVLCLLFCLMSAAQCPELLPAAEPLTPTCGSAKARGGRGECGMRLSGGRAGGKASPDAHQDAGAPHGPGVHLRERL